MAKDEITIGIVIVIINQKYVLPTGETFMELSRNHDQNESPHSYSYSPIDLAVLMWGMADGSGEY